MKPCTIMIALVLACGPLGALRAQPATGAESPEAAATSMYEAMQRKDWKAAAAAFDPAALKEFREILAPLFEVAGNDGDQAFSAMFGDQDPETIKKASDADFFAAFFGGIAGASQVELKRMQVLGSVPEGDSLRHVVTRNTAAGNGVELTKMEVVSTRKTAQGWQVLLSGELKGMAETMRRIMRMAGERATKDARPSLPPSASGEAPQPPSADSRP